MGDLIEELKEGIIRHLSLDDITAADIDSDAPLFEEGLELDSIDALELVVLLEHEFGVKIEDLEEGKVAFASVTALAQYVQTHRTG